MAKIRKPMSQATREKIRQVHLKHRAQSNMQILGEGLSVLKAADKPGTVDLVALTVPSSSDST